MVRSSTTGGTEATREPSSASTRTAAATASAGAARAEVAPDLLRIGTADGAGARRQQVGAAIAGAAAEVEHAPPGGELGGEVVNRQVSQEEVICGFGRDPAAARRQAVER